MLAPTPNRAMDIAIKLREYHPDANIQTYMGLPREANEMVVQEKPVYGPNGRITYERYTRPSHQDLEEADFVVATALTAGTSLSNPFDYCVVDMVKAPHQTVNVHTEEQKLSRARHPDVQRILVIPNNRYESENIPPLIPLDTKPPIDEMDLPDYKTSMYIGVNRYLTDYMLPEAEPEVSETPAFMQESKPEEPKRKAAYDWLRACTTIDQAHCRREVMIRESHHRTRRGFEFEYDPNTTDELEEKPFTGSVQALKKYYKTASAKEFNAFMKRPALNEVEDKVQQDFRKIVVPEEGTCDPKSGLLPAHYLKHPEDIPQFHYNPAFIQRMRQDAALAKKARAQNEIFCRGDAKFFTSHFNTTLMYPIDSMAKLLRGLFRGKKTKEALEFVSKPRQKLSKLGRITYIEYPSAKGRIVPVQHDHIASRFNAKKVTHFNFKLGWFDLDDPTYFKPQYKNKNPVLV